MHRAFLSKSFELLYHFVCPLFADYICQSSDDKKAETFDHYVFPFQVMRNIEVLSEMSEKEFWYISLCHLQ